RGRSVAADERGEGHVGSAAKQDCARAAAGRDPLDHRGGPLGKPAPARAGGADAGGHERLGEAGEEYIGVRELGRRGGEPEVDGRRRQAEEVGEGEELEELRASGGLRREAAVGGEPASLPPVAAVEADAQRGAGESREQRRLRARAEVRRDVVGAGPEAGEKRQDGTKTGRAVEDEHLVEPRVPREQRRRRWLDHPRDPALRPGAPHATEERKGAHDVAEGAREHDQDTHGSPPAASYAARKARASSGPASAPSGSSLASERASRRRFRRRAAGPSGPPTMRAR